MKTLITVILSSLLFTACANPGKIESKKMINEVQGAQALQAQQNQQEPALKINASFYIGSGKSVALEKQGLPLIFEQQITLLEKPSSLSQIVNMVTEETGVPIRIATEIISKPNSSSSELMRVAYTGSLKGLIDVICSRYQTEWEYNDGLVEIFITKTKTFSLMALSGKIKQTATINNGTGASGSDGNQVDAQTAQTTEYTDEFTAWDEITKNVQSMLTPDVGRAVANRISGTITVTDNLTVLNNVDAYVTQINDKLGRQVAVQVKVYSVRSKSSKDIELSLNLLFEEIGKMKGQISGATPFDIPSGTGGLLATILNDPHDRGYSQFEGSNVIYNALKEIGDVALVTRASGVTLNNQPMPVQNVSRKGYLKSTSTTISDTTTTVEMNPGTVTTGFSMTVTPNILDNNKVALHYAVTLSSLDNLQTVSAAGTSIQIPEESIRSFMQRVILPMGSTLVLAGFEDTRASNNNGYGITGMNHQDLLQKDSIVIMITVNDIEGA